jgi:hypothetical protein
MERGIVPTLDEVLNFLQTSFLQTNFANEITMLNPRRCGFGRMIKPDEYSPPRLPPALIAQSRPSGDDPERTGGLPLIDAGATR